MDSQYGAALDALRAGVEKRLQRVGGSVASCPELEDDSVAELPSAALARFAGAAVEEMVGLLPAERCALKLPPLPHTVLVTRLQFDEKGQPVLEPVLWWAALVRARLDAVARADIYAFLLALPDDVGPEGRSKLCARVERSERFCRKFVLRVESDDSLPTAVEQFLDRTFLAQPWFDANVPGPESLDPFEHAAELLGKASPVTVRTARRWLDFLGERSRESKEVAEALARFVLEEETGE